MTPDKTPGNYYVTVSLQEQVTPLLGPFVNNHAAALDAVELAAQTLQQLDPRANECKYGTMRMGTTICEPGILNQVLADVPGLARVYRLLVHLPGGRIARAKTYGASPQDATKNAIASVPAAEWIEVIGEERVQVYGEIEQRAKTLLLPSGRKH